MTSTVRKHLFNGLRVAVCVAALWFVVRGVTLNDHVELTSGERLVGTVLDQGDSVLVRSADGGERMLAPTEIAADETGSRNISYGLKTAWRNCTKSLLLLAILVHFPVTFIQALRLQVLLCVQQVRLSYWQCVKLSFAGNFLNFATPLGSNAGDVFKAYFVTTHTHRKTEAATTIALDRAIGLGTLILCVAGITMLVGSESRLAEFRPFVLGAVAIGIVGTIAYLSPFLRKYLVPTARLERFRSFTHLKRIDQAARTLAGHKRAVALAVVLTVALQGTAIAAYFLVAVALALDAHAGNVLEYYAYFYTGTVIQSLPGPPQGLGTVELAYRYFFAPFGSPSQIVCVAFLVRVVVLVVSLPGLLVTLTGSYKPRDAVPVLDNPGDSAEVQRQSAAHLSDHSRPAVEVR